MREAPHPHPHPTPRPRWMLPTQIDTWAPGLRLGRAGGNQPPPGLTQVAGAAGTEPQAGSPTASAGRGAPFTDAGPSLGQEGGGGTQGGGAMGVAQGKGAEQGRGGAQGAGRKTGLKAKGGGPWDPRTLAPLFGPRSAETP